MARPEAIFSHSVFSLFLYHLENQTAIKCSDRFLNLEVFNFLDIGCSLVRIS